MKLKEFKGLIDDVYGVGFFRMIRETFYTNGKNYCIACFVCSVTGCLIDFRFLDGRLYRSEREEKIITEAEEVYIYDI